MKFAILLASLLVAPLLSAQSPSNSVMPSIALEIGPDSSLYVVEYIPFAEAQSNIATQLAQTEKQLAQVERQLAEMVKQRDHLLQKNGHLKAIQTQLQLVADKQAIPPPLPSNKKKN